MSRNHTPSHQAIVLAQPDLLAHKFRGLGSLFNLTKTCWACKRTSTEPYIRAHIEPFLVSRNQSPDNFFILCPTCHEEQPDAQPKAEQVRWLCTHEDFHLLKTYWFVIDYLLTRCPKAGGTATVGEFIDDIGTDGLREILESTKTGCWSLSNIRANGLSSLGQAFESWLHT